MNRDEFFAKLSPLGEDGLRKVLRNVYWRSPAALRERIEAELDPGASCAMRTPARPSRPAAGQVGVTLGLDPLSRRFTDGPPSPPYKPLTCAFTTAARLYRGDVPSRFRARSSVRLGARSWT